MNSSGPTAACLALLAILGLAGCDGVEGPSALVRPVVMASAPLSLANPQRDAVTWPIWGSVFSLDSQVTARVSLRAGGAGTAGLVIAGPGAPAQRRAIALLHRAGAWVLRETRGDEVVQETAMEAPASAELTLTLQPRGDGARVTGHGGAWSLATRRPLVEPGQVAGIDVMLDSGATLTIRELALDRPPPAIPGVGAPLRPAAEAQGLRLGAATDIWPPQHEPGFETLLGQQFNAIAPTELYWSTTRGEDEDYFFLPADLMINYATVHRQAVTGYFLVWDFELPSWVQALAERGDARALGQALDEHIATVVGRYRDRVDAWVVVNEAIWGPEETGGAAAHAESPWLELLGPGYIERAFRTAREADPDAVLLYNETGAEALGPKSDFVHALASDFVARGVPLDGVGLQMHIDAAEPPVLADVKANMERLGALGLSVHITELDVSIARVGGGAAAALERQAAIYAGVLATCRAVPACRTYTVFGVGDAHAWDELGDASPLLFDEQYRPKPAFIALQRALGRD